MNTSANTYIISKVTNKYDKRYEIAQNEGDCKLNEVYKHSWGFSVNVSVVIPENIEIEHLEAVCFTSALHKGMLLIEERETNKWRNDFGQL